LRYLSSCNVVKVEITWIKSTLYRESSILAWVPLPSGFSMSRSKNYELRFLYVEKTKIMLEVLASQLIELLRPTFYDFIFTFPE